VSLPDLNALVDIILEDGQAFHSRVEDTDGKRLTVGAPFGIHAHDVPKTGGVLELAWLAEDRRMVVTVKLRSTNREPPRWELEIAGNARLQTRRHYVRGGGGEKVELAKSSGDTFAGWAIDVSEGGVRCRLPEERVTRDERVQVRLSLDTEDLTLDGTVRFVRPHDETEGFDVIITYQTTEAIGQRIRGYIMRREMEERRRLRASA
jgi:hypothetical protein